GGAIAINRDGEAIEAARYDPKEDIFNEFLAVQDKGPGNLPGFQFASGNHTNDLVPLWAIGAGSDVFLEFTRTDVKAGELWGEVYRWDGDFVDNTAVFHVMDAAFAE
ncbi:MAG: hypothetical protein AAGJ87_04835, partial [Pseudomonadota bacterium]